jgi:hypothetical protein
MLDWSPKETYKNAVIADLKLALFQFIQLDEANNDRNAIEKARRRVEDLTSILDLLDAPLCHTCGDKATIHYCDKHAKAA